MTILDSKTAAPANKVTSAMRFKCPSCDHLFTQKTHLNRHRLRHTHGKKRYQCSCGNAYSRSDVLQRHLRTCNEGQETLDQAQNGSDQRFRSKKACNQCARSKVKCDLGNPCQRCRQKSFECEYTRQGYTDPYEIFRLGEDNADTMIDTDTALISTHDLSQVHTTNESTIIERTDSATNDIGLDQIEPVHLDKDVIDPDNDVEALPVYGFDMDDMNFDLASLDWNSLLTFSEGFDDFRTPAETHSQQGKIQASATSRSASLPVPNGFQLHQLDSVEAKCIELRNFLRLSPAKISNISVETYITRNSLLQCIQLYAKDYHPLMPILHLPTFELTKTPSVLLLAMMLVGACYAEGIIPAAAVVQLAVHTLLSIEGLPHERNMGEPPLSVIQASALLCHILVVTKNPSAYKFASVHRARMISMAERAGLFVTGPSIDYWLLTKATFDWLLWVDTEARRRLAYHIFATDQGNHIFMRGSTLLSPYIFNVDTASFHSCWAAQTASECLQHLQNRPGHTQLSTALKRLRSSAPNERILDDVSDSAMHAIIIGMHRLFSDAADASLDDENVIPINTSSNDHETKPDLAELLNDHLMNHTIDQVAENIVSAYGSDWMRHVNKALNKWRMVWDARQTYDIYDESNTAFNHPLNFYLLAKLFIVLHFLRNRNRDDDFSGRAEDKAELFAYRSVNDGTIEGRVRSQIQVLNWLSRLRRRPDVGSLQGTGLVSQVINTG